MLYLACTVSVLRTKKGTSKTTRIERFIIDASSVNEAAELVNDTITRLNRDGCEERDFCAVKAESIARCGSDSVVRLP